MSKSVCFTEIMKMDDADARREALTAYVERMKAMGVESKQLRRASRILGN